MQTTTGDPRLDRIADELEGAGWPWLAREIVDGASLDALLAELDPTIDAEAIEIITWKP